MPVSSLPRLGLVSEATPLQPMDRLAQHLGLPAGRLWVKRDDLTASAGGGNKVRKLDLVLADALAAGADHVVMLGGAQSNAARVLAGLAARFGLGCTLVLVGEPEDSATGNLLLARLSGAHVVWCDPADERPTSELLEPHVAALCAEGRTPYVVAVGASTPLGAAGYVTAAEEILSQRGDLPSERPLTVVCASGSAATHAGLAVGLGSHTRVLGVRVGVRRNLRERIAELATDCAALTGRAAPTGTVRLEERFLGPGYGVPTDAGGEAILLAARLEGLLLDPVYTGKALSAVVGLYREGALSPDDDVVLVHTGGLPAVFARDHADWWPDALG